jgi:hypothetical protein
MTKKEKKMILEMYGIVKDVNEGISSKEGIVSLWKRFGKCSEDSMKKYPNLTKVSGGSVITMWGLLLIFIGITGEFLSFGLSTAASTTAVTAGIAGSYVGIKKLYDTNYGKIEGELQMLMKCINR